MTGCASLPPAHFERLYAADPDPWNFTGSDYERDKYAATLAALPRAVYPRALEIGCSIGVLTAALAPRCESLLAIDVADTALAAARRRCATLPWVGFRRAQAPQDWPSEGPFDLILLSEVLYYFGPADLDRMAGRVAGSLALGGDVLLVHWTGDTNYPLSGDAASSRFIAAVASIAAVAHEARAPRYRLDLLRRAPG
jgi:predicted TPR repeat methyltransferase